MVKDMRSCVKRREVNADPEMCVPGAQNISGHLILADFGKGCVTVLNCGNGDLCFGIQGGAFVGVTPYSYILHHIAILHCLLECTSPSHQSGKEGGKRDHLLPV